MDIYDSLYLVIYCKNISVAVWKKDLRILLDTKLFIKFIKSHQNINSIFIGSKHFSSICLSRILVWIQMNSDCVYEMGRNSRKPVFGFCEQHRRRPACASAQSDQRLWYSLFGKHHMLTCYRWNFNFLASLCSWGDWFETRFVGHPEDRFSRDEAQILWVVFQFKSYPQFFIKRNRGFDLILNWFDFCWFIFLDSFFSYKRQFTLYN